MIGGILPPKDTLLIKVGADYSQAFRDKRKNDAGVLTPVDITGYTVRMKVKDNYKDSTEIFDLSTTNGKITLTDPANGEFTITLTDTETGTVTMNRDQKAGGIPTRSLVFDIEFVDLSDKVIPFLIGTMKFYAEVTD